MGHDKKLRSRPERRLILTLALHAGGQYVIDPSRLAREMSPRVWSWWRALWAIDPQDANRADRAAATIASVVVNAAGAKKQDGDYFKPSDFAPYLAAQIEPEERARLEVELAEAELADYFDRVSGHKAHRYLE